MVISRFLSNTAVVGLCALIFFGVPYAASAAGDLEVSGWIPYWSGTDGIHDAEKRLSVLDEIHPFSFSVKSDGTLLDLLGLDKSAWKRLIRKAEAKDVLVTPTVMTSDGAMLHALLSDPLRRTAHVASITRMVEEGGYDGVNIDYEAKRSETKNFFSLFLKELKVALGNKRLSCAVEARTPPDSLYRTPPAVIEYANDYAEIGAHCDRVQIMAYDQQRADIKLNDARRGAPYMPVSDTEWVRKVVALAVQNIPKEKLVLGIPTYGYEYEVTVSPDWYQNYTRVRALNPGDAKSLARKKKVSATRNAAGEMSFTYATTFTDKSVKSYKVPRDTTKGNTVAAQALAYANKTGKTTYFNIVSWSDAESIEAKVDLAEEFDLRGVAIFKIDGEEDAKLWSIFR